MTLLVLTLFICILCSIDVERGAKFSFGYNEPWSLPQWYTLGTFYLTFSATNPPCVDGGDPSDYIRAGLGLMYISAFFQVLSLKISRDSYIKYEALKKGDIDRDGANHGGLPLGDSDASQRRGLMGAADDDTVEVTL